MSKPVATILLHAASKLETGAWRWNDGSRSDDDEDRDLFMAICGAAGELGQQQRAYAAIVAMQQHLRQPLGPWNEAEGRTVAEVIEALRDAANSTQSAGRLVSADTASLPPGSQAVNSTAGGSLPAALFPLR